jgi:hypothetical protein
MGLEGLSRSIRSQKDVLSTASGKVGSRSREDQAFVQIRALKTKSTPAFDLIVKQKHG